MNFGILSTILAMAPAPGQNGQSQAPSWVSFVPMALILVVFYFILIRPQQKRAKDQAALLKAIRPGDKILTSSGIVGVVITVKEKSLSIRSADAKLEIIKSAVAEITERSGESGSDS